MKYSIGEFAEIIGVTTDTLRLYEKYNIITPTRDEKNNYRYYDDLDARDILMSRWFRSLQIPLEDVATIINDPSKEKILNKIIKTEENLKKEIKEKILLLNKITEIIKDIEKIDEGLNKCNIKETPGIYRLKQTYRNTLIDDVRIKDAVDEWMSLLPHTFFSFKIDNKAFFSEDEYLKYTWGLGIEERKIGNFDLKIQDFIEYIPPKTCVSAIILSPHNHYLKRDLFQFMIDYVKKNKYAVEGDIFGKIIITIKDNEIKKSYLEVNIPIRAGKNF